MENTVENYFRDILSLKNEYDPRKDNSKDIIKKMREIHSKTIIQNHRDIMASMQSRGVDVGTQLSFNDSCIAEMRKCIKKCEKSLLRDLPDTPSKGPRAWDPADASRMTARIRNKSNTSDLLSLQNIETATSNPEFQREAFETENGLGTQTESNLTEFLNNLGTEDAESMFQEYMRENKMDKSYDQNKRTVVNFWASWCGFSKKFKPEWDKFVLQCKKEFPDLQTIDIDVENDPDKTKLSKDAGVSGFPTVILFYRDNNGLKMKQSVGSVDASTLRKFVGN